MNKSKHKSTENRIRGAYYAIKAIDKLPPTVEAVAKMTGLPVDVVEKWMQQQGYEQETKQ
jgi:hypothetical protein